MKKNCFDERRISYLQMIQGVIDRMATSSAIFKGFSATIVTGVSVVSLVDVNTWILILSFFPMIVFMILDIYYLRLERQYRFLYEKIRLDEWTTDFKLDPPDIKTIQNVGGANDVDTSILSCIKSPSIYLFYGPMLVISVIIIVMKTCGCLL